MSLPRYPEYRDSGVEWLGEVPAHWDVRKLRSLARLESGHTPSRQHPEYWVEEDCVIPWFTLADVGYLREERNWLIESTSQKISQLGMANSAARLLPKGTVLLSRTASVGFSGVAGVELAVSQDFAAWICGPRLRPYYVLLCLRAMKQEFRRLMMGSTHQTIYMPDIEAFRVPVPPVPEQEHIAAFLDHETAKIDALVAEQQRLTELLKEKRQAVISHAVTKGLNPKAPMKDSGIEWLGEVPSHWVVTPLKWLTDPQRPIMYGIVLPGPDVGDGIPILKGGNVKPSRMNLEAMARTTPEIEAPYARARLRAGDLVYSIRGSIGDCEPVPSELEGANITQDVARVAVARENTAGWVRWALLSPAVREDLASGSLGAAVRGVNIFDLKRAQLPTPPALEQAAIAAFLERETKKLDELTAEAQRAIALLKERRTALISAAVTGQIDVRPSAARRTT